MYMGAIRNYRNTNLTHFKTSVVLIKNIIYMQTTNKFLEDYFHLFIKLPHCVLKTEKSGFCYMDAFFFKRISLSSPSLTIFQLFAVSFFF